MSRRDPRVYIAVDHGMTEHPKIESLSDGAFRALFECWCWCSRNETDGRMPKASWLKRVPVAIASELLEGCLAHDRGDHVEMHDYTEHQRTAEEIRALREKRSAAGSKGGQAKAANRVASATADAKQTGSKDVAETETETETENKGQGQESDVSDVDARSRPDVDQLCELLADLIEKNGSKRPNWQTKAWRDPMRRAIDIDGRTPAQLEYLAQWAQQDDFWARNILSPAKLREKFDRLRQDMLAERAKQERDARPVQTVKARQRESVITQLREEIAEKTQQKAVNQ